MDPNNSNPNPTINLRLKISISSVRSTITNIFIDLFIYSFVYILFKERWMALRARDNKLVSLIGGCMGNLIVDLNGTAEPNLAGLARGISNRPYKKGAYRTMFRCVSFVGKKNFPTKNLRTKRNTTRKHCSSHRFQLQHSRINISVLFLHPFTYTEA